MYQRIAGLTDMTVNQETGKNHHVNLRIEIAIGFTINTSKRTGSLFLSNSGFKSRYCRFPVQSPELLDAVVAINGVR